METYFLELNFTWKQEDLKGNFLRMEVEYVVTSMEASKKKGNHVVDQMGVVDLEYAKACDACCVRTLGA